MAPQAQAPVKLDAFENTPIENLPSIAAGVRLAYVSQKTRPIAWRIQQLRKLYWGLVDLTPDFLEALKLDVGKSVFESQVTELEWCKNDIVFVTKNLEKWAQDESPPDITLPNKFMSPVIRKQPLGAVLVIGCWNFPIQLSIGPFIGAIAAGCTAVLKPSEISPASAMVLKKLIERLDSDCFAVANGGKDETTVLLNEKWDKIFYTGNSVVGTIIAKKAAETLTPIALELGGRNPAFVTRNTDLRLAARRLLWGKHINAGQVCISQNYTMVDADVCDEFIQQLRIANKEYYPNGAKASPDFGRIVSDHHFNRVKKMLDSTQGKIVIGGATDAADRFIEPTVVLVKDQNDSLITEESFGPLLPVLPVANLDEAIRIANEVHSTPLGLYAFGNKEEVNRILAATTSGGATIGDALFHASIPTLAFGGVGDSGQGSYRGKASFDCFSHRRPITRTPGWMEKLLDIRYPPYSGKLQKMISTSAVKPNFDRQLRTKYGITDYLRAAFLLGGSGVKEGFTRWVLFVLIAAVAKKGIDSRGGLPDYLR
ncbi:hypothetical protein VF21_00270 [Pseudogymnoascus sp. 05NY08]|nr:hypothetical protein VF21_00025 [Pseudogymnoascus sp. 05NY08]OBT81027.1 hypothetical protein VF21_00270 [Pseudogymnoascus sp. 05NY08]